jgi:structural hemagglutinin/hemolysin toxin protein RtxA
MYKICFFVPENFAELVKDSMFAAGAGKVGNYSCCAWQVLGEGQFMPGTGSKPFTGSLENLEKISEYKIEMVCDDENIKQAIAALKNSHPYEEPAYQVWKLENI